jgi:hypothetical protein
MSETTPKLALPFLQPAQAGKHLTINDALTRLDAAVQLCVVSATTAAQPTAPTDGSAWILPAGRTGAAWGTMPAGAVAVFDAGAWEAITPGAGWFAFARDEAHLLCFDGATWSVAASRAGLGLGSAATQSIGTSGAAVPLLNGANLWSADQTLTKTSARMVVASTSGDRPLIELRWSTRYDQLANDAAGIALVHNSSLTPRKFIFTGTGATIDGAAVFHAGTPPLPASDNTIAIGSATLRFSTVYAATGTINTSDAREKTPLEPLPDALLRAIQRILAGIGVYQWQEAIARKGSRRARLHVGVTAQAVEAAFAAEGLEARRYGLFCRDGRGKRARLGLRMDQLVWLALAAMQQSPASHGTLPPAVS